MSPFERRKSAWGLRVEVALSLLRAPITMSRLNLNLRYCSLLCLATVLSHLGRKTASLLLRTTEGTAAVLWLRTYPVLPISSSPWDVGTTASCHAADQFHDDNSRRLISQLCPSLQGATNLNKDTYRALFKASRPRGSNNIIGIWTRREDLSYRMSPIHGA